MNEIRASLWLMQDGDFCAYCERVTGRGSSDGHVEHFRQQNLADENGLDWSNMFWSCNFQTSCGKKKDDDRRYDQADLIDPASEDPERMLQFVVDGTVRAHPDRSAEEQRRSAETIRVFALDTCSKLKAQRRTDLECLVRSCDVIRRAAGAAVLAEFVAVERTRRQFSTAVRQLLDGV